MNCEKPSDTQSEPLSIRLFGAFQAEAGGKPLSPTRTHKERWLLSILILRHHEPLDRHWLAGLLWPDSAEDRALQYLRRSLSNLRDVLGTEAKRLISATPRTVSIDVEGAFIDVLEFDAALKNTDRKSLEKAVELYRGPLLEHCPEEWAILERELREQAFLQALQTLGRHVLNGGDTSKAVMLFRRMLLVDPLRESAMRDLMRALGAGGDLAALTQTYREFRLRLLNELHTQPDGETTALYQSLKQEAKDRVRAARSQSSRAPRISPRRFPSPGTSLIGREREIQEITRILGSSKLLTLTGSGGVGKTRLAIAVAQVVADEFDDGVWFVDLSPVEVHARTLQAVAVALDVREEPARPLLEGLVERLEGRSLLLILDSCEHLASAAASLAQTLLDTCPQLRLLATSRQPLALAIERTLRVPSLSLPQKTVKHSEWDTGAGVDDLGEAVLLFAERAKSAHSSFQLTSGNLESVIEICRLLDGIPLAIELAAAWMVALSPAQVAARLRDRLDILQSRYRGTITRQQTLRATLDWSFSLLDEEERRLLLRLSVFAGGFTLEAAEAVGQDLSNIRPFVDLLTGLVDKSLVLFSDEAASGRYRLLETTRQYAESLLCPDERKVAWGRHLQFYCELASVSEEGDGQPSRIPWHDLFEREHDNFRSALDWSRNGKYAEKLVTLSTLLCRFWYCRGYLSEGRQRIEAALEHGRVCTDEARARALNGAGTIAFVQGDFRAAEKYHSGSLELYRQLDDPCAVAIVVTDLGILAHHRGDLETAKRCYDEGLEKMRRVQNNWGMSYLLGMLGRWNTDNGNYVSATQLLSEGLELAQSGSFQDMTAFCTGGLAQLALLQKNYPEANALLLENLELAHGLGDKVLCLDVLEAMATLAAANGQVERAGKLMGAAASLRRATTAHPMWESDQTKQLRAGFAQLDHNEFEAARLTGSAMELEDACEYARGGS